MRSDRGVKPGNGIGLGGMLGSCIASFWICASDIEGPLWRDASSCLCVGLLRLSKSNVDLDYRCAMLPL